MAASRPQADIHDLSQWDRKTFAKEGGKTAGGELGGIYADPTNPNRILFVKQDEQPEKMISEFLASRIMRAIMRADPAFPKDLNIIAEVEFTRKDASSKLPDEDGKNVYLASVGFNGFKELHKDAYAAYTLMPKYEPLHQLNPGLADKLVVSDDKVATIVQRDERPQYFTDDQVVKRMVEVGRYPFLLKLLALSLFVDNFDVHMDNIGTIPKDATSQDKIQYQIQNKEKTQEIHDAIIAVLIDLGAAFGDPSKRLGLIKRNLDGKLHLEDFLLLSKVGPPNYFRAISQIIFGSPQFSRELYLINYFPKEELFKVINDGLKEVNQWLGPKVLKDFCNLVGVSLESDNQQKLTNVVLIHLFKNLADRQNEAGILATKKLTVDMKTSEIKESAMMKAIEHERVNIEKAMSARITRTNPDKEAPKLVAKAAVQKAPADQPATPSTAFGKIPIKMPAKPKSPHVAGSMFNQENKPNEKETNTPTIKKR